ncbi:hypothetical protein AVEN_81889-1 [Araneus ventricosus]|uniref:Uncharacterized protein n=1 Tax=Araneus ventricosus TaxID=182803 RepID=A0A4Y2I423_ARAVE|nr:hypothetical protein AVEN_81889-1 [Araneus ventricosus]
MAFLSYRVHIHANEEAAGRSVDGLDPKFNDRLPFGWLNHLLNAIHLAFAFLNYRTKFGRDLRCRCEHRITNLIRPARWIRVHNKVFSDSGRSEISRDRIFGRTQYLFFVYECIRTDLVTFKHARMKKINHDQTPWISHHI